MSLTIGRSTSAASLFVLRAARDHQDALAVATRRLSSGSRLNSAADDPSAVGTVERLKSSIAEDRALSGMVVQSRAAIAGAAGELAALKQLVQTGSAADLAAALRAPSSVVGGLAAFGGNPAEPTQITTHHAATSGSYAGAAFSSVTLAPDTAGGSTSTVALTVDGAAINVTIASGSYTAASAAAALRTGLDAAGYNSSRVAVDGSGGAITITSGSTGTGSTVSASGTVAAALGLTDGTATGGADAYDTTVDGEFAPRTVAFAGRAVTLPNLTTFADAVDNASTPAALDAVKASLMAAITATTNDLDAADRGIVYDEDARQNRLVASTGQLEGLTGVDIPAEVMSLARAQLGIERAAFVARTLQDTEAQTMRTLLGIG